MQRIEERHVQALFDPLKRGQVNSLDFHCISILDCIARNNTRSLLVPQVSHSVSTIIFGCIALRYMQLLVQVLVQIQLQEQLLMQVSVLLRA